MNAAPIIALAWSDWVNLLAHYLALSFLSVGGAITTLPEMHRFLVEQQGWLSDAQFNASIAIAQASPGPNVLFVALMGWNVGINAGGMGSALIGALLTTIGILLPSTTLSYMTARWSHRNRGRRSVRAFKQGMSPIVIALLVATGWILASALLGALLTMSGILLPSATLSYVFAHWSHRNRDLRAVRAFKQGLGPIVIALLVATGWILAGAHRDPARDWPLWLLTATTALIIWRSKIHLLWLLAAGALLGGLGLV